MDPPLSGNGNAFNHTVHCSMQSISHWCRSCLGGYSGCFGEERNVNNSILNLIVLLDTGRTPHTHTVGTRWISSPLWILRWRRCVPSKAFLSKFSAFASCTRCWVVCRALEVLICFNLYYKFVNLSVLFPYFITQHYSWWVFFSLQMHYGSAC